MGLLVPNVLNELLGYFDENDVAQSHVFTLVCHEFLEASRRRSTSIRHIRASSRRAIRAAVEMLSSPLGTISNCVRAVTVGSNSLTFLSGGRIDVSAIIYRCSQVTKLDLQCVRLSSPPQTITLPVTHLRLSDVEFETRCGILDVLRLCPRAISLTLIRQSVGTSGLSWTEGAVSVIEALEMEFKTGETATDASFQLLSSWMASEMRHPRLERLNIFNVGIMQSTIVDCFLSQLGPSLKRLSVFMDAKGDGAGERLQNHEVLAKCKNWFRNESGEDILNDGPFATVP